MSKQSNEKDLIQSAQTAISSRVDDFTTHLMAYLDRVGLPTQDILVPVPERKRVIGNLPGVIEPLAEELRVDAGYLSKFVAACGVGLFDAALNYLWDETIKSLREKVARLDLDYFCRSVIHDAGRRGKIRSAEDLVELADWELIKGCHVTGIISDLGFKHLDYIRDMRNWASAAHPNQNSLTGLQLVSWLETCLREVIAQEPAGPVIEIRRLLHNLRNETLAVGDLPAIEVNIGLLHPDLATSLLRTVFGMYTDTEVAAGAKANIKLIARSVWEKSPKTARHEVGLRHDSLAANAEVARRDLAHEFLEHVDGLAYLGKTTLALQIGEHVENLANAHDGFNNFHNEPAHAKNLSKYIGDTGEIPDAVRTRYVKVLTMCKIGNGYGVSNAAEPFYDGMMAKWGELEFREFASLLADREFASRLQFETCAANFRERCDWVFDRSTNTVLKSVIDEIRSATPAQLPKIGNATRFRRMLEALGSE